MKTTNEGEPICNEVVGEEPAQFVRNPIFTPYSHLIYDPGSISQVIKQGYYQDLDVIGELLTNRFGEEALVKNIPLAEDRGRFRKLYHQGRVLSHTYQIFRQDSSQAKKENTQLPYATAAPELASLVLMDREREAYQRFGSRVSNPASWERFTALRFFAANEELRVKFAGISFMDILNDEKTNAIAPADYLSFLITMASWYDPEVLQEVQAENADELSQQYQGMAVYKVHAAANKIMRVLKESERDVLKNPHHVPRMDDIKKGGVQIVRTFEKKMLGVRELLLHPSEDQACQDVIAVLQRNLTHSQARRDAAILLGLYSNTSYLKSLHAAALESVKQGVYPAFYQQVVEITRATAEELAEKGEMKTAADMAKYFSPAETNPALPATGETIRSLLSHILPQAHGEVISIAAEPLSLPDNLHSPQYVTFEFGKKPYRSMQCFVVYQKAEDEFDFLQVVYYDTGEKMLFIDWSFFESPEQLPAVYNTLHQVVETGLAFIIDTQNQEVGNQNLSSTQTKAVPAREKVRPTGSEIAPKKRRQKDGGSDEAQSDNRIDEVDVSEEIVYSIAVENEKKLKRQLKGLTDADQKIVLESIATGKGKMFHLTDYDLWVLQPRQHLRIVMKEAESEEEGKRKFVVLGAGMRRNIYRDLGIRIRK